MRTCRGLSLLELLTTIAVFTLLATFATPLFTDLGYDAGRAAAVNDFVHALFLARSESLKRGSVVSLCKSADGNICTNNARDWSEGWMVFDNQDHDDPPMRDADEAVLQVYPGWRGGHVTSNRKAYSFRPRVQAVVNGTVVFCDPRGSATARAIIISRTGRPRLARRDSSNKPLRCAAP